jgi:hypothetical protein
MGFWHTGYLEFHEPTGLSDAYTAPTPVFPRCQKCGQEFPDVDTLTLHRFEKHPYLQPALLIDGVEFVAPRQMISKQIKAENIRFMNTITCWLNGEQVTTSVLSQRIAEARQKFISVRLRNDEGAVETSYDLDIGIPEKNDIIEVEKRFFELSSAGNLTVISINNFIQVTRDFPSAGNYVDGLSKYLYGVLGKDQRGGTSLTREEGRARMTSAQQLLARFDTPLSVVVTQTVNFNLNAFNDGLSLQNSPQLARVMQRFWRLLHPSEKLPVLTDETEGNRSKQVPLDVCTNQLVEWSLLSSSSIIEKRKELEKTFSDDNWIPDDRFKVQILLINALNNEGDGKRCSDHARRLRHHPQWGKWAESLIQIDK